MGSFIHIQQFGRRTEVFTDLTSTYLNMGLSLLSNGQRHLQFGKKVLIQNSGQLTTLGNIYACPELTFKFSPASLSGEFAMVAMQNDMLQTHLTRDAFGTRSLYYYFENNLLLASSEINLILAALPVKPQPSLEKINEYFRLDSDDDEIGIHTFFQKIFRVLPGQICSFGKDGLEINYFWNPDIRFTESTNNLINYARNTIIKNVKSRVNRDSKIAAHLSGGLDSSSVVCILDQFAGQKANCIYFDSGLSSGNEIAYAKLVSQSKTGNLTKVHSENHQDVLQQIISISACPDPMVVPSLIFWPIYEQMIKAKKNILFSGQGGDSIMGFGAEYLDNLWNERKTKESIEALKYIYENRNKKSVSFNQFCLDFLFQKLKSGYYWRVTTTMINSGNLIFEFPFWLLKKIKRKQKGPGKAPLFIRAYKYLQFQKNPNFPEIKGGKNLENFVKNNRLALPIQAMENLNALDNHFEVRTTYPFLSKELLEINASIPVEVNFANGNYRGILRQVMKNILPEEIRLRTDKANFADYAYQTTVQLIQESDFKSDENHQVWQYIDKKSFKYALQVLENPNFTIQQKSDYTHLCYRTLNLAIWLDIYYS